MSATEDAWRGAERDRETGAARIPVPDRAKRSGAGRTRSPAILPCAALLLALPLSGPTLAQEGEPRDETRPAAAADSAGADRGTSPEPARAAEDTVELEELVVTAHRVPLPRDALTGSVTVIDREEIESSGAGHVLELLRTVPGASVVQSGSTGDVTSLFLRGGESNFVQVLVDGVPLNRPGGDVDLSTLTTDNVERIEVVRGPASVLYGSDAVTGVVQIFTREGDGPPTVTASAEGGSHGTLDWEGALAGGSESARYSLSVSRFVTDGILELNDDHRNTVASARVRLRPDPRTEASLSLRYTDNETGVSTNSAGVPTDANAFRFGETVTLSGEAARSLTDRLEARVLLTLNEVDDGFDDVPDGPADTLGFFAFQSQADLSRQNVDTRLNYSLDETTVFTVGFEFENEEERSTNESRSSFGTSRGELEAERRNLGYYAQAVASVADGLALTAGLRVDDNEEFGTFTTFRGGLAYGLPTGTRLRASYGTAFKEPTFLENFSSGFVTGNPDLDPEESESWEVGVEQRLLGDRVSLAAVFFDQDFEDLIQFTFSPPEPDAPNFFNVAEAEARGVELSAEVSLPEGLFASANYTYLDTEVVDAGFQSGPDASFVEGDRLLRRPTHSAGFGLGWRLPGTLSTRLSVDRVGEREDRDFGVFPAPRVELPPYTRIDLAARYTLPRGVLGTADLTPVLRIENLADDSFEEVVNFPAPGRTVFAGLEVSTGF